MTSNRNDNIIPLDDLMRRAGENKLSGREALDLERKLQEEAKPEGVFAPITLASPQDTAPVAYILHKWRCLCLACNTEHKWSEVYALNHLRAMWGKGTYVKHMVPVHKLEWNVPLVVHEPKTRTTPFCHDCLEATTDYLSTLPKVPEPSTVLKYSGAPETDTSTAEGGARKTKAKPFTVDDLMI